MMLNVYFFSTNISRLCRKFLSRVFFDDFISFALLRMMKCLDQHALKTLMSRSVARDIEEGVLQQIRKLADPEEYKDVAIRIMSK